MRTILNFYGTDMKNEKSSYRTNQKNILIDFLRSNPDKEFSTDQIAEVICGKGIGKSTVYRLISKLCDDGEILRTHADNGKKSLYRYIDKDHSCDEHFHLKCRDCGKIIHLECGLVKELGKHIEAEHGFHLDIRSTVINGVCEDCERKENAQ
jgi:Fur family ferric uptake transcriptional regulator